MLDTVCTSDPGMFTILYPKFSVTLPADAASTLVVLLLLLALLFPEPSTPLATADSVELPVLLDVDGDRSTTDPLSSTHTTAVTFIVATCTPTRDAIARKSVTASALKSTPAVTSAAQLPYTLATCTGTSNSAVLAT